MVPHGGWSFPAPAANSLCMRETFHDRVALVTGASRGLGRAVAQALGANGAHVIALARTVGGLEELDDAIRSAGGAATLVPLDVTDDEALARLGAAIHERWGRLDFWFHTAIHAPLLSPAHHIDAGHFDRALAINVRATQRLIRVLDPLLRQAEAGRAIVPDDPDGREARFHGAYQATKQAQIALAAAWASEVETITKMRILTVTPPPMATAMRARFYPGEARDRLATPAQVAERLLAGLAAGDARIELGAAV